MNPLQWVSSPMADGVERYMCHPLSCLAPREYLLLLAVARFRRSGEVCIKTVSTARV